MNKIFNFIIFTTILFFALLGFKLNVNAATESLYTYDKTSLDFTDSNYVVTRSSTNVFTLTNSSETVTLDLSDPTVLPGYDIYKIKGIQNIMVYGSQNKIEILIVPLQIQNVNTSQIYSNFQYTTNNVAVKNDFILSLSNASYPNRRALYFSNNMTITGYPSYLKAYWKYSYSTVTHTWSIVSYPSNNNIILVDGNYANIPIYYTDFDIKSCNSSSCQTYYASNYITSYKFDNDISDSDIYEYSFNIDISAYSTEEYIPLELTSYYYSKGGLDYVEGQDYIYTKLKAPFLRITYTDGSISLEDNIVDDPDSDTVFDLNYSSDLYNRESNRITKVELVYDMSYTSGRLLHIFLKSNLNFTTSSITDQYYHENNNLFQLVLTGKYAVVFSPKTTVINQDNNVNFELHSAIGFDIEIRDGLDLSNNDGLFGTDKNIKTDYYYYSVSKSNPSRYLVFYNLAYGKYNYGNDYAVTIWYNSDYFTYTLINTSTSSAVIHNDNTNEDVTVDFEEKTTVDNSNMVKSLSGKLTQFLTPVNYIIDRVVDLYNILPDKVQDFFFISFLLGIIVIVIKIVT